MEKSSKYEGVNLNTYEHSYLTQIFCGIFKIILDNYQEDYKFLPNILASELISSMNLGDIENFIKNIIFNDNETDEDNEREIQDFENSIQLTARSARSARSTNVYNEDYDSILTKVMRLIEDFTENFCFNKVDVNEALLIFQKNSLLGKMNASQLFMALQEIFDSVKKMGQLKLEKNVSVNLKIS